MQTDVTVAHLAFDLGARHQSSNGVDHQHVESTGANQHVGDFEGLFTCVWLGDQQLVHVDSNRPGVDRVEGMLSVDERRDAPVALRLGDDVQSQGCLARALRTI